tara:strand:+ start:15287 stop:15658 length:372 start_codon:yes stop_codon:yes gene_type:complete
MKKLILLLLLLFSCGDDYMTHETRIINSTNKYPVYFYTEAEQAGENTWRPIFYYFIYAIDEGEFAAYFHAYVVDGFDSVLWVGVQPITVRGGERIWGEFVAEAEFSPHLIPDVIPMAFVSVAD